MTSSPRQGGVATSAKWLSMICLVICLANKPVRADLGRQLAQLWEPSSSAPHPAVVRVTARATDGVSHGSGTLVEVFGNHGLVITNWHVVREGSDDLTVQFPDGFESAGQLLKVDENWDLAAVAIWRPPTPPMPLADAAPQPGDFLAIAGYGQEGKYRAAHGRCTQYVSPGLNFPFEMVETSVTARQGDSGGPMINEHGELAGVLFGSATGVTSGSYIGRVNWFLDPVLEHLRQNGSDPAAADPALDDPIVKDLVAELAGDEPLPDPFLPTNSAANRQHDGIPSDPRGRFSNPKQMPNSLLAKVPARASAADAEAFERHVDELPRAPDVGQGRSLLGSGLSDGERVTQFLAVPGRGAGNQHLPHASMQGRPVEVITLDQLAGRTGWEKTKTLLALVGVLALLSHASWITGRS